MHILQTVLYTLPKVLTRRIRQTIKSFFQSLVIISLILVILVCDSGVILLEEIRWQTPLGVKRFTNLLVWQTTLSLVTYSAMHVQNSSFTFSESSFSTSRLILLNMKGFKIMWSLESWSKKQMERTEKVEKELVNNLNNRSTKTDGRNRDIWKRILWLPLTTGQPRQMVRTEKFEKGNYEHFKYRTTETNGKNRKIWKRKLWILFTTDQPKQVERKEKFKKGKVTDLISLW